MVRFQIYLEEEQARRLADLSRKQHVPKSELIREGIDLLIRSKVAEEEDPLLSLVGQAGLVGRRDISEKHDAVLVARKRSKS